jgi:hypothetical protein
VRPRADHSFWCFSSLPRSLPSLGSVRSPVPATASADRSPSRSGAPFFSGETRSASRTPPSPRPEGPPHQPKRRQDDWQQDKKTQRLLAKKGQISTIPLLAGASPIPQETPETTSGPADITHGSRDQPSPDEVSLLSPWHWLGTQSRVLHRADESKHAVIVQDIQPGITVTV